MLNIGERVQFGPYDGIAGEGIILSRSQTIYTIRVDFVTRDILFQYKGKIINPFHWHVPFELVQPFKYKSYKDILIRKFQNG